MYYFLCGRVPVCGDRKQFVYHGNQFDTKQMWVGVLKGCILRMLASSNRQQKQMELSLQRLILEVRSAEHGHRHILDAINGGERQSLMKLSCAREVLEWTPIQACRFRTVYDVTYRWKESSARLVAALRCLDGAR